MATVAQMIEFLSKFPPDTIVKCGAESGSYQTYMIMEPVDIESCSVHDYSSIHDREKYPHMGGKIIIEISAE